MKPIEQLHNEFVSLRHLPKDEIVQHGGNGYLEIHVSKLSIELFSELRSRKWLRKHGYDTSKVKIHSKHLFCCGGLLSQ